MDIIIVYVYFISILVLLGISWNWFNNDIISPSVFTLIFFGISAACFIYNSDDWRVVFSVKGYLLFISSFVLMMLVELVAKKYRLRFSAKPKGVYRKARIYIVKPIDRFLATALIVCALLYVYRVYQSGMVLGASGLFSSIGVNKEEGDFDTLSRLLYNVVRMASYVYIVILTNNIIVNKDSINKYFKEILVLIATIIITFFSGQRSSTICYLVSIFVSICISTFHLSKDKYRNFLKNNFYKIIIVTFGILTVFFVSANIVKGTDIDRELINYMTYYFGSTIALMGKIVENPDLCHTPFVGYFGEKTFNGLYTALYSWGVLENPPCERVWMPMEGREVFRAGNEYTFFCGPYIDFGFLEL